MSGAVVVISSTVSRGTVGLRATQFALERRGHEVWPVPTIALPWHPGLGPSTRLVNDCLARQLDELAGAPGPVSAIATGYFATAEQVEAAARFVQRLKGTHPNARFVCDPVSGDSGGRYVPDAVAAALRTVLLPLADVATPNVHEVRDLTGHNDVDLAAAAASLGPPWVVVTSVPVAPGKVGVALYGEEPVRGVAHEEIPGAPKGTGDLFLGVLVANLVEGAALIDALSEAAGATHAVVAASRGSVLAIASAQEAIAEPSRACLTEFGEDAR